MRALGVDFGSKRIGLATGVNEPMVATSARTAMTPTGALKKDAANLAQVAAKLSADVVVIGVPVNAMDDRMERICRRLAEELRSFGLTVETVDESLTSVEAEDDLRANDLTAAERRKLRDGEAARRILERYFAEIES